MKANNFTFNDGHRVNPFLTDLKILCKSHITILQVVVHGFIESDSYSPLLNISVIPQVTYRLAPAIWKKMYNYDPNWYGGHRNQEGAARTNRVNDSLVITAAVIVLIVNMTRTREKS